MLSAAPGCLSASLVKINIKGIDVETLIDSGSSHSFIKTSVANSLGLSIMRSPESISLASKSFKANVWGHVDVDFTLQGKIHKHVRFGVMDDLCADALIGIDFMVDRGMNGITLGNGHRDGARLRNKLEKCCNAAYIHNEDSCLFKFLKPNCKPIASKSRNYCEEDRLFIASEVQRLLDKGIIENSSSPWRAQVIVTKDGRHKRRMVIDYSRTINIYTELDAYPLPRIDKMVNDLTKYTYLSTLDLENAYYQEAIPECDRPFTAFEANGRLYQFTKIPFGVTNGVAAFQRNVDLFIDQNNLKDTFAYVDNWTVGGRTLEEHNTNLKRLMDAAQRYGYKFNKKKCEFNVKVINLLGYTVTNGQMRPDEDRLKSLREMPLPHDMPADMHDE